jgi:hypothetical protein
MSLDKKPGHLLYSCCQGCAGNLCNYLDLLDTGQVKSSYSKKSLKKFSWKEMVSMPNTAQQFRVTSWRDFDADCGHAMPFALENKAHGSGGALGASPVFALIQGRGMPISRGSPPTSA